MVKVKAHLVRHLLRNCLLYLVRLGQGEVVQSKFGFLNFRNWKKSDNTFPSADVLVSFSFISSQDTIQYHISVDRSRLDLSNIQFVQEVQRGENMHKEAQFWKSFYGFTKSLDHS